MAPSEQLKEWRIELEDLRQEFSSPMLAGDQSDVDEVLQTCLESLDACLGQSEGVPTRTLHRRSIDLVPSACVTTDHCCIIRRTNNAFLSILGLSHSSSHTGMPFLLYVQKEDRRRFMEAFLRLRSQQITYANEMFFTMKPAAPVPCFLAHLSAHAVAGKGGKLQNIVWMLKKTTLY